MKEAISPAEEKEEQEEEEVTSGMRKKMSVRGKEEVTDIGEKEVTV